MTALGYKLGLDQTPYFILAEHGLFFLLFRQRRIKNGTDLGNNWEVDAMRRDGDGTKKRKRKNTSEGREKGLNGDWYLGENVIRNMAFRHVGGIKYSRETPCVRVVSFVRFFALFPRIREWSFVIGSRWRNGIMLTKESTAVITPKTRHLLTFCLSNFTFL